MYVLAVILLFVLAIIMSVYASKAHEPKYYDIGRNKHGGVRTNWICASVSDNLDSFMQTLTYRYFTVIVGPSVN